MAWNGSDKGKSDITGGKQKATRPSSAKRGILAGLGVLLAGGGILWYTSHSSSSHVDAPRKNTSGLIAEVKPQRAPAAPSASVVNNAVEKPVEVEKDPAKIRVKTLSFTTNALGNIVDKFQTADGKTHKVIRPAQPPLFRHGTDDIISMALAQGSSVGMPPLPLSGNMDKEFLKSLEEPIIIEATDSDEIKERKRIVREARVEIKKLMDQGMHFAEIMADHEKVFNENAEERTKAIAEARRIRDAGDTEGTAQYVEAMNAAFETMGIEKIDMPKSKEERRAAFEARKAARAAAKDK